MSKLEPTKLCTYTPQVFDILSDWDYSKTNIAEHIADKLYKYNGIVNIKFAKPASSIPDASIMPFANNCTLTGFCQYRYANDVNPVINQAITVINLFGLYGQIGVTNNPINTPKFIQFSIIGNSITTQRLTAWKITKAIIDATIDSSASYTTLPTSDASYEMPADIDSGIHTKSLTINTDSIKNEILNSISGEYVSATSFSELKNYVKLTDSSATSLASKYGALNSLAVDISNKLNNQKGQADGYVNNFNEFVQEYNNQKDSMEEMFNSSIKAWKKMLEDSSFKTNEATQAADAAYNAAMDACTAAGKASKAAMDACTAAGKASNAVSDSSSKINKFQQAFDASYAEYAGWLKEANKNASTAVKNAGEANQVAKEAVGVAEAAYGVAVDACTMADSYYVNISNRFDKIKNDLIIIDGSIKDYQYQLQTSSTGLNVDIGRG